MKRFKNLTTEVATELRESLILNCGSVPKDANTPAHDFANTLYFIRQDRSNGFKLADIWQSKDAVPFWAMFKVEESLTTGMYFNFMLFLPLNRQSNNCTLQSVI